jgi:hypothetical protein
MSDYPLAESNGASARSAERALVKLQRPNEAFQLTRGRRKVASEARHSAPDEAHPWRLPASVHFNELLGGAVEDALRKSDADHQLVFTRTQSVLLARQQLHVRLEAILV